MIMVTRKRLAAAAALLVTWLPVLAAGPAGLRAAAGGPAAPEVVWRLQLPGHTGVHLGPASPGALALFFADQPGIYVPNKVSLVAVEMRTGVVIWKGANPLANEIPEFAADADRFYFLSVRDRQVSAWRWDTGQRLWASRASTGLLAQDGLVVWIAYDGYLVAADGATGRKLWDRGFAPRDEWTPMTIALGSVYLSALGTGQDGFTSAVIALGLRAGAITAKEVFNPHPGSPYAFDYLRWSPRAQLFYGQDGVEGAGVHGRSVRVIGPDLSPIWERADIRDCQVAGDTLVCEAYHRRETGPYVRTGPIGVELATGRTLWQWTVPDDGDDNVIGEWNGTVVVMHRQSEARSGKLAGLRPGDGHTMWELPVPVAAAGIYGDRLVAALEPRGQPAGAVAYRMP